MFTHVDWAHMVMVLALPGNAERCLQRGGRYLFHSKKKQACERKPRRVF